MISLQQYKQFFIEDNGQGKVRLLNENAEEVKTFDNTLSAKMWVEIQKDDQYKDLRKDKL